MTLTPPSTQVPQRSIQIEHHEDLNEQTIRPENVYVGTGTSGQLTAAGLHLRSQNPRLTECLIDQAQFDLHQKYPHLYPPVQTRAIESPGLRQSFSTPATMPSTKPRLPDDKLAAIFGKDSHGGKANLLARTNITLYRRSRDRAEEIGLLPARSKK